MSRVPDGVDPQQLTVVARRVLLDGLDALHAHREAITVVGAQAVYLRSASAAISTAAYTSDGDLGLDPQLLADHPLLEQALIAAGFSLLGENQPGLWGRTETIDGIQAQVELDLLVGSTLTAGGRGARIQPHDKMTARKVAGLETSVVDRSPMTITALEDTDDRSVTVNVAGPVALLVAKAHKLKDRFDDQDTRPDRLSNKDAGDAYRIMMATPISEITASAKALIADPRVGEVTALGLRLLREQFGGADTPGVRLAIDALAGAVLEGRIRVLAPTYVNALLSASGVDDL